MFFIKNLFWVAIWGMESFRFYLDLIIYTLRITIQNNEIARLKREENERKRFLLKLKAIQKTFQRIKSNISFILVELDANAKSNHLYKKFLFIYPLVFIPHLIIFGVYTLEGEAILTWFADIKRQVIRLPSNQWFGYWVSGLIAVLVTVIYILCVDMSERDLNRLFTFFSQLYSTISENYFLILNKIIIYMKCKLKTLFPYMLWILTFCIVTGIIPPTLDQSYAMFRAFCRRHPIFLLLVGTLFFFFYFYLVGSIIILIVNYAVNNFIIL